MKRIALHLFLIIDLLTFIPSLGWGNKIEINGIMYDIIDKAKVATVISGGNYSGDIEIPSSVVFESVEYSVIRIDNNAFENCTSLTSIIIPNSVTSIGTAAFIRCRKLKNIILPNSITTLSSDVFLGCYSLESISIPESVTTIKGSAFSSCTSLSSINLPNSLTTIEHSAFYKCIALKSITIPDGVTQLDSYTFYECTSLSEIILSNNLTSIGIDTFRNCTSLTTITFPNNVTSIGFTAFYGCSNLSYVNIGSGIKFIDASAFGNCSNLETVICHSISVPNTDTYAFYQSLIDYSTLIVPDESIDVYKSTSPWSDFGSIQGLSGSGYEQEKCATPIILYTNGKLTYNCETEGATCHSTVKAPDAGSYYKNEVQLGMTYKVEAYASKPGYIDSDVSTLTINLSEDSELIKGDINKDSYVNMTDVTEIINIILGK